MIIARFLGPANFGIINYAESVAAFVGPIMQLGLSNILVHHLVNHKDEEGMIIGTSLCSCLFSGILCMTAVAVFSGVVNHGETETILVCILYSFMLLAQAIEIVAYWFEAHLMSKYTSVISLCAYIAISAYKIFLLATGKSIYWFAVSNALDHLLIGIAQLVLYKKLGGAKLTFSFKCFKDMFGKSKYYILSGMMIAVFSQTDRVMLKLMIGNAVTGYYSAAVRCADLTAFVFVAIINSAIPVIYESRKKGIGPFENNMKRLYSIVMYIAFAQSFAITVLSKPIIYILYGKEYMAAVPALCIITWYIAFSYMGMLRNRWMLAEGIQHLIWRIDLSGAIANVILNLLLIPRFSLVGAAVASLITQIFTNFILGWIIKDVRRNNQILMESLNPKVLIELVKSILKK